jgi:hypothetical protein
MTTFFVWRTMKPELIAAENSEYAANMYMRRHPQEGQDSKIKVVDVNDVEEFIESRNAVPD